MAFFRGPQSPREEQFPPNPLSPPQRNPNRWSASMATTSDVRGGLHRRFTTSTVPTLTPIGQQRRQAAGDPLQQSSTQNRLTPSEHAARRYEDLLQQQRRIQEELEKVDAETRREVDENIRHEQSVKQLVAQSEPTTPPEYHAGFPTSFSRPSRYSNASLTSPPGILTRPNRASTQLTSPAPGYSRHYVSNSSSALPSQSVPGSRRQSDDEDEDNNSNFIYGFDGRRPTGTKSNRNSMPISSYERKRTNTDLTLGPINTTSYLFESEDKLASLATKSNQTSPPDTKTYLQVQHTADGFPKLIRREDNVDASLSAASAALDLAFSTDIDQHLPEHQSGRRQRISLPPNGLSSTGIVPLNGILANVTDNRPSTSARRSMEVKFTPETKRPTLLTSPPRTNGHNGTQSSYSTNDLPTLKSINGDISNGGVKLFSPKQSVKLADPTSPDQNMTRRLSTSARQIQDFSINQKSDEMQDTLNQTQSGLQANASMFGPHAHENGINATLTSPTMQPYGAYYNGYSMQMMQNGFSNLNVNGNGVYGTQAHWPNGTHQQSPYIPYTQFPQNGQAMPGAGRFDQQRPNPAHRRQAAEDAQAKFNSISVDQLIGEIYALCKDQHGCRYLQRKLEERNEQTVQLIFDEVKGHMTDLMVDPFGNYLCQKLLESTNDDQRTALIRSAMPSMTKIALNQHGTRALQKMIEFISTPEQTVLIIEALGNDVVVLIQDLNGNHVIQKLLNHLSAQDAQFIFDAVGANCVIVGTHRHGCCVLQRCIDHADGLQKGQMVDHVVANAHSLVQDPFGNYVIQYILDLNEPSFTEPLCQSFLDDIANLSRQKFSSNVIEKCIRCCSQQTKNAFVTRIMDLQMLERLLRDSFANYVVQTAMDFAEGALKRQLINNIRTLLPFIRNTPHGRRIASKIGEFDQRNAATGSDILSSLESTSVPHPQPQPPNQQATSQSAPAPILSATPQSFPAQLAAVPATFASQNQITSQPFAAQALVDAQGFANQRTTAAQAFGLNATAGPQQFGAQANGASRNNRHGFMAPSGFDYTLFGSNNGHAVNNVHPTTSGHQANNIVAPTPQRSSQSYNNLFNGGQTFQNGNYGGQGSQSYGQF